MNKWIPIFLMLVIGCSKQSKLQTDTCLIHEYAFFNLQNEKIVYLIDTIRIKEDHEAILKDQYNNKYIYDEAGNLSFYSSSGLSQDPLFFISKIDTTYYRKQRVINTDLDGNKDTLIQNEKIYFESDPHKVNILNREYRVYTFNKKKVSQNEESNYRIYYSPKLGIVQTDVFDDKSELIFQDKLIKINTK